jgi:hypothetical protein
LLDGYNCGYTFDTATIHVRYVTIQVMGKMHPDTWEKRHGIHSVFSDHIITGPVDCFGETGLSASLRWSGRHVTTRLGLTLSVVLQAVLLSST